MRSRTKRLIGRLRGTGAPKNPRPPAAAERLEAARRRLKQTIEPPKEQ